MTDEPRSGRFFGSRGVAIGAAIVVAVVVALAVVIAVTPRGGKTTPQAHSTASAAPSADESVCGLPTPAGSASAVDSPPATKWVLEGRYAVPTSKTLGPGTTTDAGIRTCYAHSAAGALVAAANVIGMTFDKSLVVEVARTMTADVPGRAAAIASAEKTAADNSTLPDIPQIAAFRVLSYGDGRATVDLALRAGNGKYLSYPIDLVWESGDWKLDVTANGKFKQQPAALLSLGGYTVWAGA